MFGVHDKFSPDYHLAVALSKYDLVDKFVLNKSKESKKEFKSLLLNRSRMLTDINFFNMFHKDKTKPYELWDDAMTGFFEECNGDVSPLNMWGNTTIGVELEFVGISKKEFDDLVCSLAKNYPHTMRRIFNEWKVKRDASVVEEKGNRVIEGTEIVSPILMDTKDNWKSLNMVCNFIKLVGGKTNPTCGGHIHIGSEILGVDSAAWDTFLKMWREVEPLMYMITNRKGESVRDGAKQYAIPKGEDITNALEKGTVSLKNRDSLLDLAARITNFSRYASLNLKNIECGNKKNTIEFRLANGSVDYGVVRENIQLYAAMLQFSKTRSLMPSYKKGEFDAFFETDIIEEEKLNRFLNLIFDDDKVKDVYKKRWEHMAGKKEKVVFNERRYIKQTEKIKPQSVKTKKTKKLSEQLCDIATREISENTEAFLNCMGALVNEQERENWQEVDFD